MKECNSFKESLVNFLNTEGYSAAVVMEVFQIMLSRIACESNCDVKKFSQAMDAMKIKYKEIVNELPKE